MKKTVLISLLLTMLFTSCNYQQSEKFTSTSADKQMTVEVQGSRESSFDPFRVQIIVNIRGEKIETFQEVYADEITPNNVAFEWTDSRHCKIKFSQRDQTQVTVPINIEE